MLRGQEGYPRRNQAVDMSDGSKPFSPVEDAAAILEIHPRSLLAGVDGSAPVFPRCRPWSTLTSRNGIWSGPGKNGRRATTTSRERGGPLFQALFRPGGPVRCRIRADLPHALLEPLLQHQAIGTDMIELDHLHVELSGMNLIEASAGTGKTYAIACLYLRLLIEKDLTPEQILVVTYTEAATEELRGRIRSRIREALEVFAGGETKTPFSRDSLITATAKAPTGTESRDNLDRALKSFDTASIFTIHGFCLRALQENAFESGSLYDTELVTDQTALLQEIVDDFWRMRFFRRTAPLLGYALRSGYSPAKFMEFLKGMLSNPKLEVIPRFRCGRNCGPGRGLPCCVRKGQ